jgi:NAD(P)-dependent dehydrogenase (short-subunit alcohol dehydrogenase family)
MLGLTSGDSRKERTGMGQELAGKVAIVTGGASGIGRATVELFAGEGARVVVADIATDEGDALAASLGDSVAFRKTDVSETDDVQALVDFAVDRFGGLDVMVNNAGISSSFRRFLRDDLRDFDRVMGVNLFGVIIGTQRAGRHMAEHGGGSIINTSSIGGLTGGGPPIAYRTSKAAIAQFSRMVATDLAEFGIRVNCIAPGHIPTGITNYDLGPTIAADQPLQRQGSPEDVAEAILFLAGDRSAQITGIVVPVDGGTVAGRPVHRMSPAPIAGVG